MQVPCYISAYILPEENTADQNSLPTRLKQDMSLLQRIYVHPPFLGEGQWSHESSEMPQVLPSDLDFPCIASLRTTQH